MDEFKIQDYSEDDTITKLIKPALQKSGWDLINQLRENLTLTPGKIFEKNGVHLRGKPKFADLVLYHSPNMPIAVIEAKKTSLTINKGMQQAIQYSEMLDVPFAISSNGKGFILHDRTGLMGKKETFYSVDDFPKEEYLWNLYKKFKNIDTNNSEEYLQGYHIDSSGKEPRYYQEVAVNKVVNKVLSGKKRNLLVMATGSGKTYTAFQIMWRLWKSGKAKRILFLADRNILVDQARINDFVPFGENLTKIRNRKIDTSYGIFLSLYHAITGPEEKDKIFKQVSKDFFDLIVVDECHRGSASQNSEWREVLDYFDGAVQIGLTATPKETDDISTTDYFGEADFTYSLKQGIEDGYLAPFKIIRIDIDRDLEGWRPAKGQIDKFGKDVPDRIYDQKDFDKTLILEKRTELVAKTISDFLKKTDPYAKTIVFCNDIDHAERMRSKLVVQNSEEVEKDSRYVMTITGDNKEGKNELDNFIDPKSIYPVIATTSDLLSTGVDVQTCKLIVIDKNINSLSLFKQIIGRGTRVREDFDKYSFTIFDFRKATQLFSDPEFDGDPIICFEPKPEDDIDDIVEKFFDPPKETEGREKYYVPEVNANIISERTQYFTKDGKLVTEEMKQYTETKIKSQYKTLSSFLAKWNAGKRKMAIVEELEKKGIIWNALIDEVGTEYEPFDLICHIVYNQKPLTRAERANNVIKRDVFTKYGDEAKEILTMLLEKYADYGIDAIEDMNTLKASPFNSVGTVTDIIKKFDSKEKYDEAIMFLQDQIYREVS